DALRSAAAVAASVGEGPGAREGVAAALGVSHGRAVHGRNGDRTGTVVLRGELDCRRNVAGALDVGRRRRVGRDWRNRVLHVDALRSAAAVAAVVGEGPGARDGVAAALGVSHGRAVHERNSDGSGTGVV